ncbi:MAG: hypothetical protein HC862_02600 [Scytonema sp. RU_4_4]|nr:hypothetical protein [Scytonema sp. RU_4_4]NJR74741.1 hypothetical protein [Scytonema sp. CRU_2_7]
MISLIWRSPLIGIVWLIATCVAKEGSQRQFQLGRTQVDSPEHSKALCPRHMVCGFYKEKALSGEI